MSRMFGFENEWLPPRPEADDAEGRDRMSSHDGGRARRDRSRRTLVVEPVEERVLLSGASLRALADAPHLGHSAIVATNHAGAHGIHAAVAAQASRIPRAATLVTNVSGFGVMNGTATLSATVTSNGAPLQNAIVRFQLKGKVVAVAFTDVNGVAIVPNVRLKNFVPGTYPVAIKAVYGGDPIHRRSISLGALSVSQFPASLTDVSGGGTYNGNATLTATLKSNGTPLTGQTVQFLVNGKVVGTAPTDGQGIATLSGVSLSGINTGVYADAITARFEGGITYTQSTSSGTLTVNKALAIVALGNLTQAYDGTPKSVTVTTSPAGLLTNVSYTDSTGKPVASPTNAGSYSVIATVADPNYVGFTTGTLVITPVPLKVNGTFTAADKTYNGTTTTTVTSSNTSVTGLLAGDSATLVTTQAFGVFDSKNVGTAKLVAVLGLALSGPDASNYVLIPPTTTANITPAPIAVSGIVADNKVYDSTTEATLDTSQATFGDDAPPEDISLNFGKVRGEFDSKGVGTGKSVVVTGITLDGADAANYLVIPVTTKADITAATLTVTGIKGVDKPFDGTTAATLDTSAAVLQGVFPGDDVSLVTAGATGTFDTPDVGNNKTVTVSGLTLAGADAGNYTLIQPTTTANIT